MSLKVGDKLHYPTAPEFIYVIENFENEGKYVQIYCEANEQEGWILLDSLKQWTLIGGKDNELVQ